MFQFYSNCCIRNVDIQCLVYSIQSTNEVAARLQAVHHEKQYITYQGIQVGEIFRAPFGRGNFQTGWGIPLHFSA